MYHVYCKSMLLHGHRGEVLLMAVYKRKNTWYIDYYIRVNGKRERRRESAGSRRDVAENRLREYRELIRQGIDPQKSQGIGDSDSVTTEQKAPRKDEEFLYFEDFVPIFLELHGKFQSSKMQESYRSSLGHLILVFGQYRLNRISKVIVQTYMTDRKREGTSNATVNREVACLKSMLARAVDWEYLEKNPLHGLKLLKEAPVRERYLADDEAKRLIAVSPPYLCDIIIFALATGMRKSEIFNIRWEDVTLDKRFGYGSITVIGKGGKRRVIRMNRTVYELMLKKHREGKNGYVFTSPKTGGQLVHVDRSFKTALKKAGITNFRFHDLRHTAASWMVQGGADIYAVQTILGHSHIKTTQRYAHQSPEYLGNQISILDDFLGFEKAVETKEDNRKIEAAG